MVKGRINITIGLSLALANLGVSWGNSNDNNCSVALNGRLKLKSIK